MDANVSYPLVVLPPEHALLVPVATGLVADSDPEPDSLAWLWQRLCKLTVLLFLLLAICWRLCRELIELREQANYWKAQHQRAVQRQAVLAAQVDLLQGELREWKRRFVGRKSETTAVTTPTSHNHNNAKKRKRGQQPGSKGHGRPLRTPRRSLKGK